MLKILTFAALIAASPAAAAPVQYMVTPVVKDGAVAGLDVEISLDGDADGETRFLLPQEWAGTGELWKNIDGISAGNATLVEAGPAERILRHAPGARITFRYTARPGQPAEPGFDYQKAVPLMGPDWFFFHGEGLFAVPLEREAAPVSFRWGTLPPGWKAASDLDHLARQPGTIRDISESVGVGGARLNLATRHVGGAPLSLAMIGDWGFEPAALADAIHRIYAAENAYWGVEAQPFLVAMGPLGAADGHSYHGTGRGDGFSIASTTGFELAAATQFLAHEINHRWMPAALGDMPQNEGTDYWFSEGFNDFLTARMLVRAGLWSLPEFADYKNRVLLRYAGSPAKNATAEEIAAQFWTDQAMQQMSYDRGHLLAMLLDSRIVAASGGRRDLDDVLAAQLKLAKAERNAGRKPLATALFATALRDVGGIDAAADIARYTRSGEPILLPADLFGRCAAIATTSRRPFHRGYDADATAGAGGVIAGVRPDGPAYAAGMRDGMRLVRREFGTLGDSTVEIGYRVEADGAERVIRYMPEGEGSFDLQQMALAPAVATDRKNQCTQLFGGT